MCIRDRNQWAKETGDYLPQKLTEDWYHREPVYKEVKESRGQKKLDRTPQHGLRGEMPGSSTMATKNNNKGPF